MERLLHTTKELEGLVNLYYLLIAADGKISDKEIKMGDVMCEYEKIDKDLFQEMIHDANHQSKDDLYNKCVTALRQCEYEYNIKCVAWMSLIANSDGFMSSEEWSLIFKLYSQELHLDLKEIMTFQKTLPKY